MIKNNPYTKLSMLLVLAVSIFTILTQQNWDSKSGYIKNDVRGYYAYLPAVIIHQDLSLEQIKKKAWYHQTDEGRVFIKYTSGNALCHLPGFLLAHGFAKLSSYSEDGYSLPYQISLILTALLFLFLSLRLAAELLHRYFKDKTVALTLLAVFIGTNYYFYSSSLYLSYSHIYSFYFILLFLKYSMRILEKNTSKDVILLGFSAGMMTLIRPVDGVFLLFPILYQVNSTSALLERIKYMWSILKKLLISAGVALLVWLPQLMYNFHVFRKITINGYRNETFIFTDPELWNTLFSFNNGWLIYSPLMTIAVLGVIVLAIKKQWWWGLISFLYLFVISSWWCWWYVGFGNRAAINLSAFMLFPLSYIIEMCLKQKLMKYIISLIIALGIFLNIFQTKQFEKGYIRSEGMTYKAYKTAWLNNNIKFEFYDQIEKLDVHTAKEGINAVHKWVYDTLAIHEPVNTEVLNVSKETMYLGSYRYAVDSANTFVAEARISKAVQGMALYGKLMSREGCDGDEYGGTSISKTEKGNYKLRSYYRYKENALACADSIHYFIYNKSLEETDILNLKFYVLRARDTLVYLE